MVLHVLMMAPEELACFVMGDDGKDSFSVAFSAKEYTAVREGWGSRHHQSTYASSFRPSTPWVA
jgi:hypothetical protein